MGNRLGEALEEALGEALGEARHEAGRSASSQTGPRLRLRGAGSRWRRRWWSTTWTAMNLQFQVENQLDESGSMNLLRANLTGDALELVRLSTSTAETLAVLMQRYCGDEAQHSAWALQNALRQKPEESLQQWLHRLDLNGRATNTDAQRLRIMAVRNLSNEWIRENVQGHYDMQTWLQSPQIDFTNWRMDLAETIANEQPVRAPHREAREHMREVREVRRDRAPAAAPRGRYEAPPAAPMRAG